ncbi:MAG: glycosyltransferase [Verrucomicrobia bacterium]|nr:glycosyltransferase [Verrucomicrobiota bacterium]
MMAADICTSSTEELASRIRFFNRPALVLPNGFDLETFCTSASAVRKWKSDNAEPDVIRLGYAGGSPTHQRDFAAAASALARVLRESPRCRLVLFRDPHSSKRLVDLEEFPEFSGIEKQVEWRDAVPLQRLPQELARFDINLAPLEFGNPYCEAKSELKFFEAALVRVPTIASSSGPFRRAIKNAETGYLAETEEQWYSALRSLIDSPELRRRLGHASHLSALWHFGPLRRADLMLSAVPQLLGRNPEATRSFALEINRPIRAGLLTVQLPRNEIVFSFDQSKPAEVSVVIPLYNYAQFIEEALDSVRAQTLSPLDLIIVDDCSADDSLALALKWSSENKKRFNRILILRNDVNSGLALARNAGFDAAATPFILPLDADNRLLPECCSTCLEVLRRTSAAFAYPSLRKFGAETQVSGKESFDPARFIAGNFIDAMSLIRKEAWAAVGGFGQFRVMGWEDYDFWCRLVERGLWGIQVGDLPLAEYRVHAKSMLKTTTLAERNRLSLFAEFESRHPWLNIIFPDRPRPSKNLGVHSSRLLLLLPILRCPETGESLQIGPDGNLITGTGSRSWPVISDRPNLFPGLQPQIMPQEHVSNPLPENALEIIAEAQNGLVLNLSAGGTSKRFDNVIEAEAAIFRHTDVVADAHHLPFVDSVFDAVIVMNAFEHYRDPKTAAKELFRVLKPGGKLLVQTAFLQPLHEKPFHFYNATRYGLEEWFKDFETDQLRVSPNFSPGFSISWLASECDSALRRDISPGIADVFLKTTIQKIVSFWREAENARNGDPVWSAFQRLPQQSQEVIAAGFEYLGRRPIN